MNAVGILAYLEVTIAVLVIGGAVKSMYNGYIHDMIVGLRVLVRLSDEIDLRTLAEIDRKLCEISTQQNSIVDALIALTAAHNYDDVHVSEERLRERFERDRGPSDLLDGDGTRLSDDD